MRFYDKFLFDLYKKSIKHKILFRIFRRLFIDSLFFYFRLTSYLTFKSFRKVNKHSSKKILSISQAVWGDYIDLSINYNIPSLLQEGNIPKLVLEGYEIHLHIYTSDEDKKRLLKEKKYTRVLKEFSKYGKVNINSYKMSNFKEKNDFQIKALLTFISVCLENNSYFLLSMPDFIFGNESIYNALRCVEDKGACFASSHARVSLNKALKREELKNLSNFRTSISNPQLVKCVFESTHEDIKNAFDKNDLNSTSFSGLSIREINSKTYSVIHNLPSVHLGKFNTFDLVFYHLSNGFNHWDKKWNSILLRSNRMKICGSSDVFFALELTKDSEKIPHLKSGMLNNDIKAGGIKLEHFIQNQFISIWNSKE